MNAVVSGILDTSVMVEKHDGIFKGKREHDDMECNGIVIK